MNSLRSLVENCKINMLGLVNLPLPPQNQRSKICWKFDVNIASHFETGQLKKPLIDNNWKIGTDETGERLNL